MKNNYKSIPKICDFFLLALPLTKTELLYLYSQQVDFIQQNNLTKFWQFEAMIQSERFLFESFVCDAHCFIWLKNIDAQLL